MKPISTPKGIYTPDIDISLLPVHPEAYCIPEPALIANSVPWTNKKLINKLNYQFVYNAIEHRKIGNKITVLVLCYGPYFLLHKRCLDSIITTVPVSKLDLRIAVNCVGIETLRYVETLPVKKIYRYNENKYKYPIMRDMLYDPDCPINTSYFVWFDDTAYVQNGAWLDTLCNEIIAQPSFVGMYGLKLYYRLDSELDKILNWLKTRDWYKGKPLRNSAGRGVVNGDCSHFCADWFFAMKTDVAKTCNIPDIKLKQHGGAVVIGEQLYQNNIGLKCFNLGKAFVYKPLPQDLPIRNNLKEQFPWQDNYEYLQN